MASWLGLNPNCYTGGDCWDYDYSDRWLLIFGVCAGVVLILHILNKRFK
jgi:hypothetical protein